MSYMKNKILFFVTVVLLALFCVGCDNSVENGSGTGFVRFGEDDASRSLDIDDRLQCPVEDTYWAYTAVKVDGLHTTGESEKGGEATDTGINGTTAGGYKLRPVKNGPAAGLGVCSQEFAYGDWEFKIYGFRGYDPVNRKFTDMIYTGDTVTQKVSASATALPVNFIISVADDYPETATLAFGVLSYKVPADMMLYKGTKITATFIDKTNGNKVLATAVGSVSATENAYEGTVVPLDVTLGDASAYDGGSVGFISTPKTSDYTASHDIAVEIVYQSGVADEEESVTPVAPATPRSFPVVFRGGLLTVLSGDVNDIKIDDGTIKDGEFGVAVAYTGTPGTDDYVEYPTFAAAVASNKNPVVLLADINNAGVINRNVDLFPKGFVFRNAKFSGTSMLTIYKNSTYTPTSGVPNTYKFWGNGSVLNSYCPCDGSDAVLNVWINTTDCDMEVEVNIGVNTYHNGSVHDIDIVSCGKRNNNCGYYLGADVSNELKVYKDTVYISDVYVAKLLPQVDAGVSTVKVRASSGTRIGNYEDLFYGRTEHHGGLCQVKLMSNATGVDDIVYYVPFGMYCEIPRMIDMSRYVLPLSFTGFVDKVHLMQYRDHSFIKWTSTASATASGCVSYPDGFKIYIDGEDGAEKVFYAQWSNCLSFIADCNDSSVKLHRIGVFTTTAPTYQYSRDGYTWNDYTIDTEIALEKLGDRVFFKGSNTSTWQDINTIVDRFMCTGRVFASGTPTSLIDNGAGTTVGDSTGSAWSVGTLFSGTTNLCVGPYISAVNVPANGYRSIFNGCPSLEYVPKIIVGTTNASSLFQAFRNTALRYVDFESANALSTSKYIFAYNQWLKSARFVAAPNNSEIFQYAFYGCNLLDYVRVDFATGLASGVTRFNYWLDNTKGTSEGGTLEYFGRSNVDIEVNNSLGVKVVPAKWTRVKITSW